MTWRFGEDDGDGDAGVGETRGRSDRSDAEWVGH